MPRPRPFRGSAPGVDAGMRATAPLVAASLALLLVGCGLAVTAAVTSTDLPDGRTDPVELVVPGLPPAPTETTLVLRPAAADRSLPLRRITPIAGGGTFVDHGLKARKALGGRRPVIGTLSSAAPDGALQATPGAALTATDPVVVFDGVDNRNGLLPPDPSGEIGPNHFVQWVNTSLAIFDRSGRLLYGPSNGNVLWSGFGGPCETRNDGDPIVQYDQLADRWVLAQLAVPGGSIGYHECIAVSATPDPTGAWYRYDYLISLRKLNDYPKLGVWPDGYYLTANQFLYGQMWAGSGVGVFERAKLLAGDPTARLIFTDVSAIDPNLAGLLPADLDGTILPPAGSPNLIATFDDGAWSYTDGVDRVQLWEYRVDWTDATATFTRRASLPVASFDSDLCGGSRSCIGQRDTGARLDPIPDRLMYRLAYRVLGGRPTLVLNHTVDADGTDRAGVRWYQLEQTSGSAPWTIRQQGTFAPADGLSRWMGSIALNRVGDLALAYSVSGTTQFPALRYSGRLAGDAPDGTVTIAEASLTEGTGAQTANASRWGDYTQLSLDPLDDCTFWYTGEYIGATGLAPWRTAIGAFRLSSCGLALGTVAGSITDAANGAPLAGATIAIPNVGTRTSATDGSFSFADVYPGTYAARIRAAGFLDASAGITVTEGGRVTLPIALQPILATGWLVPSWTGPGPGGDGNGYESNGTLTAVGAAGGTSAGDVASGTKSSSQCDSTARDSQDFTVPVALTQGHALAGIAVRLRAATSSTSGSPRICVRLSSDGGKTWTDGKLTPTLGLVAADFVLGSTSDPWQVAKVNRTWTASDLAALRVRISDLGSTTSATYTLDAFALSATFR